MGTGNCIHATPVISNLTLLGETEVVLTGGQTSPAIQETPGEVPKQQPVVVSESDECIGTLSMKVERARCVVCSSGAAKRWWRWRSTRSQQQRRRMPAQIPTKLFPFANPPLHRLETAGTFPVVCRQICLAVSVVRLQGTQWIHTDPTSEDVARGPRDGGLHQGRPTALVPPTAALYVAF